MTASLLLVAPMRFPAAGKTFFVGMVSFFDFPL
jgi:hypothetical protein